MRYKDIVMTLLENLPTLYKYLIIALKTMPTKELTMDYVAARLMHEMTKRKEKKLQSENVVMTL